MNASSEPCDLTFPRSRYLLFFGLASVGCLADLFTKHLVFQWLGFPGNGNVWWLWPDYVGIQTALNPGALFGMGKGFGVLFATLSIVAAIGINVWLFHFRAAQSVWLTTALGLITGGIFGNLYDRLGLWAPTHIRAEDRSAVRDWILFRWQTEEWSWPNFNIADSLLVTGAVMLLCQAYSEQKPSSVSQAEHSG